ncbi:hypothetical protein ACFHWD_11385 [Clostridium sp. MT-14]|uniref:hypothetical protein n=1 Tax=Clostridium sp. MT-14 TaxID=3348360 RepID=UPI0035F23116
MDKPIIKEFEGNKIATLVWNDRVCWIANNIASALDYADPSTTVGQCIKGEDFKTGIEYQVLRDKALKKFKDMVNVAIEEISVPNKVTQLTIFYEEGLFGFTVWAHKPTGIRLRKWIRRDVLPAIHHTGGYIDNDDLFVETYLPFADDNTKAMFKNTLSVFRKQNKELSHKQDVIDGLVKDIPIEGKRKLINRVVRYKGASFKERWDLLYKQFEYDYGLKSIEAAYKKYNQSHKPKLTSKIDYVDKILGMIPELYKTACVLFESDIRELQRKMFSTINPSAIIALDKGDYNAEF